MFDHYQFTLIHGHNILTSYAIIGSGFTSPPDISTTCLCLWFGSASPFLLELFLHSSSVAYWTPMNLGIHLLGSYLFVFSYSSWCSHIKNAEVVCIPSPMDYILSELFTMVKLQKAVIHIISLVSFL